MTSLADPLQLGGRQARNRIFFGPHETNLASGRAISERHVAYYRERALGGAGVIVTEEASVDATDWPYERAPLAESSAEGWEAVAGACHNEGSLVLAAIGHAGGQGSSAYHQRVLLGPSNVPDVVTREVPKEMEEEEIAALVASFGRAAHLALEAGLDGVEVNAGQWSLLRQFASGLTNLRSDDYGSDKARLLREVLVAVRGVSPRGVVGLRFSCDELAPWAGLLPETAAAMLADLGKEGLFDYVSVVRGSGFATADTRPAGHVEPCFNKGTAGLVRARLGSEVAVVLQGSVVDPEEAEAVLASGLADAVELTRAQIADPSFASLVTSGGGRPRPCLLCNQQCQVRDPRNPIVSCVVEPRSGYETSEPAPRRRALAADQPLLVVGGGPAGLECALTAALAGFEVRLLEKSDTFGGVALLASRLPGKERMRSFVDWLVAECRSAGVALTTGHEVQPSEIEAHVGPVVICSGSRPGRRRYEVAPGAGVTDVLEALSFPPSAPVAIWDPVGGPAAVGAAELLAASCTKVWLVTPDFVAGQQLSRSGDLAPANGRLARAGVEVVRTSTVTAAEEGGVRVRHRFSGEDRLLPGAVLIDAGFRLPDESLSGHGDRVIVAGDAVAPRTLYEAVLEGRRAAQSLLAGAPLGAA